MQMTMIEALNSALGPEERALFERRLRPLVEANSGRRRMAHAYLAATKPI